MSESPTAATDLTSQYSAQVAGDLERNVNEQKRITDEIAALQQRLTVLQHDHTVLVSMRQALGLTSAAAGTVTEPEPQPRPEAVDAPAAGTVPGGANVPAPRGKSGAEPAARKPKRTRKVPARATSGKAAAGKPATPGRPAPKRSAAKAEQPRTAQPTTDGTQAARTGAGPAKPDGPKLVELVRRHLGEQSEPRSAAEIAGALEHALPGRTVKVTVVRSTLEGLVARNRAQRSKQGSSVFYTAPDSAEQAPEAEEEARS
ncbi:gamma-butyrolactone-binding regulator SlbR [Streptomyces sp. KM77-8]|uniref:Gamma-butyrolactone-binding regulator SlbR n=1 Tax=Streptomyces haneummycinicus TaxID=3074435 RepID=A0AAT9HK28_9ACTN